MPSRSPTTCSTTCPMPKPWARTSATTSRKGNRPCRSSTPSPTAAPNNRPACAAPSSPAGWIRSTTSPRPSTRLVRWTMRAGAPSTTRVRRNPHSRPCRPRRRGRPWPCSPTTPSNAVPEGDLAAGSGLAEALHAIAAIQHAPDPVLARQIPVDRTRETGLEGFGRPPAEFALDLRRIDRVAAIVSRPVPDVADERLALAAVGQRLAFVEQGTYGLHDMDVLALGIAAHVVDLADAPDFEHTQDRAAVVPHVEPVAYVAAIAIHRQRLAGQRLLDHQRYELFRELERPVIVGTVRRQYRQPVGMVEGADQMIRSRLRCRVRRIGLVRRLLGETTDRS